MSVNAAHISSSLPGSGDLPDVARSGLGQGGASPTALRWAALNNAAAVVAALAVLDHKPCASDVPDLPALARDAGGWRRALAEQGVDDLAAIMEPGIAAILAAQAHDGACAAAALALWHEFDRARTALLALVTPGGSATPHRQ